MSKMIRGIFVATVMLLGFGASAEILLEPYVGGVFQRVRFNPVVSMAGSDWESSGLNFGVRAAYTLPMLFLGIDYSLDAAKAKQSSPASHEGDLTGSAAYALVGMHFSNMRAWIAYGFVQNTTFKNVPRYGDLEATGGGLKLGVSTPVATAFSVNFEYRRQIFENVTTSYGTVGADGTGDAFSVGVSYPWEPLGAPSDPGGVSAPVASE